MHSQVTVACLGKFRSRSQDRSRSGSLNIASTSGSGLHFTLLGLRVGFPNLGKEEIELAADLDLPFANFTLDVPEESFGIRPSFFVKVRPRDGMPPNLNIKQF